MSSHGGSCSSARSLEMCDADGQSCIGVAGHWSSWTCESELAASTRAEVKVTSSLIWLVVGHLPSCRTVPEVKDHVSRLPVLVSKFSWARMEL